MKILGDETRLELMDLRPLGQIHSGSAIPVIPGDNADEAPC